MPPTTIIEHFNIFENALPGLCPCFITVVIHMLCLERMEKALSNRIVVTITLPAHALDKAISIQYIPKISARILNPSIRMEDASQGRAPPPYSLIQCLNHQVRSQSITHGPSDYLSGIEVQNHYQIQPAFQCWNIRNIRGPYSVWLLCHKVLTQKILSNRQIVL